MKKFLIVAAAVIGALCGLFVPTIAMAATPMVAVGASHSCYLSSAGAVMCWGSNFNGQLGIGSRNSSAPFGLSAPVSVSGLSSGVVSIAAGNFHTCALTSGGGVLCWGTNLNGQLGSGSFLDSAVPVLVSGLSNGVVSIAAGGEHTCALTSSGAVLCWGSNEFGEAGIGTVAPPYHFNTPVAVAGLTSGVAAISAGYGNTCALANTGAVWCWGSMVPYGTSGASPSQVSGLSTGVSAITVGEGTACALSSGGRVECWGKGRYGQLGNGATSFLDYNLPVTAIARGVVAISARAQQACALTSAGAILCWGINYLPWANNVTPNFSNYPVSVAGIPSGVVAIAVGEDHACVLTGAEVVLCWGHNSYGQLGDGSFLDSAVPVAVQQPSIISLALIAGWNLVGNGVEAPIAVATTFNDATKINSVWKWVASARTWAFYSPSQTDGGAAYASTRGYRFLTTINAGEGFWVNAISSLSIPLPFGAAVSSQSFRIGEIRWLLTGWNLIATGDKPTPNSLNCILNVTNCTFTATPEFMAAVWAWDAAKQRWYFWAPSLVNNGTLASYINSKGYLDFSSLQTTPAGTLSPTTGFWVNMP